MTCRSTQRGVMPFMTKCANTGRACAGIRPKIHEADFLVQGQRDHGVPGLVNLFGIESSGLTSALALAGHVLQLI